MRLSLNEISEFINEMPTSNNGAFPPNMDTKEIQNFKAKIINLKGNFNQNSLELILEEIKERHQTILETQKILENKAYINIGVLGIVLVFLSDHVLGHGNINGNLYIYWILIIGISVINLISIFFAYKVLISRKHTEPDNRYNIALADLPADKVIIVSIIQYFKSNTVNNSINQEKSKHLKISTNFLIISIFFSTVFIIMDMFI